MTARTSASGLAGLGRFVYRNGPAFIKRYQKESRRPVLPAPATPRWQDWKDTGLYAAWLGHSTVLIQVDGYRILTDPVFSERCGLGIGPLTVGVKRLIAPALLAAELPKIDLILLSHAHFDHMDLPSLRSLSSKSTAVVTAKSTADILCRTRFASIRELGWDEKTQSGPTTVRAFEVNHWGARYQTDRHRGYNGYVVEAGRYRMLFAGDTALITNFRSLRSSHAFDLAIMPIGAYDPWIRVHCNPEQAWRMANDAGAEHFLPVHHQTFPLSREPFAEPIQRFLEAAGNQAGRVPIRAIGQESRVR